MLSPVVLFGLSTARLPLAAFGSGIFSFMNFTATGSNLDTGICRFGKGWFVNGSTGAGFDAAKSPARSSAVGGNADVDDDSARVRIPWYEPKKKSLLCKIGPPTVPPNWLYRSL